MDRRFYSISFGPVAVSAAIDAFEVTAPSGKSFVVHEVFLGQSSDHGDAAAEGLGVLLERAASGFTAGSGGSAATPQKINPADAAASVTAKVCNTTGASGTLVTLRAEAFSVQAGWPYMPLPEFRPAFREGEACVVSLTAPADEVTLYGTMSIEEVG